MLLNNVYCEKEEKEKIIQEDFFNQTLRLHRRQNAAALFLFIIAFDMKSSLL